MRPSYSWTIFLFTTGVFISNELVYTSCQTTEDLRLKDLRKLEISGKSQNFIDFLPSFSPLEMKISSVLAKISWKKEVELFL